MCYLYTAETFRHASFDTGYYITAFEHAYPCARTFALCSVCVHLQMLRAFPLPVFGDSKTAHTSRNLLPLNADASENEMRILSFPSAVMERRFKG